ncbi:MAG: ParB/RepB/Spo0J family partition protein [Desulfuromonadales bacterium]
MLTDIEKTAKLHTAAESDDIELLKEWKKNGGRVSDADFDSVLYQALRNERFSTVKWLVKENIQIISDRIADEDSWMICMQQSIVEYADEAADHKHYDIAKWLLKQPKDYSELNFAGMLERTARDYDFEFFKWFCLFASKRTDISKKPELGDSLFSNIMRYGTLEKIKWLFQTFELTSEITANNNESVILTSTSSERTATDNIKTIEFLVEKSDQIVDFRGCENWYLDNNAYGEECESAITHFEEWSDEVKEYLLSVKQMQDKFGLQKGIVMTDTKKKTSSSSKDKKQIPPKAVETAPSAIAKPKVETKTAKAQKTAAKKSKSVIPGIKPEAKVPVKSEKVVPKAAVVIKAKTVQKVKVVSPAKAKNVTPTTKIVKTEKVKTVVTPKETPVKVAVTPPKPAVKSKKYTPRTLYSIAIDLLHPDSSQPRKKIDSIELDELVASIKRHGILQPILFQEIDGKLIIVAGERRYQAAKLAMQTDIPAIYIDKNPAEIALVENLLRVNLTPIEEAEALKRLQKEANYTQVQLAEIMGKAESTVSEIMSLMEIPEKLRDKYRSDKIFSRRKLLVIAKLGDKDEMKKAFKKLIKAETKGESGGKKESYHRTVHDVFMSMITALRKKIESTNFNDIVIPEAERTRIADELMLLTGVIENSDLVMKFEKAIQAEFSDV